MSCKHSTAVLSKDDRYYVNSAEHNNCVFCLVNEKGPMTQDEISKYLEISKMRVCQVERRAVSKLSKRINLFFGEDFPLQD